MTEKPSTSLISNEAAEVIINQLLRRDSFLSKYMDPRRDIDKECGYAASGDISPSMYKDYFDREPIATRVVDLLPEECWRIVPQVYEVEDNTTETEFEKAWKEVATSLKGGSRFEDQVYNPIWEVLKRADILSGVGHFGVILLGVNDGKPLNTPIEGFKDVNEPGFGDYDNDGKEGVEEQYYDYDQFGSEGVQEEGELRLLFIRAFDESLVEVTRWENRITSPRFGQPVMYQVTLNDPRDQQSGVGLTTSSVNVHWSRVIHLADNLFSSEVIGVPRMRPVINRIQDLRKTYAGSAEMYWQGAFPGIVFESDGNTRVDFKENKEQVENFMNSLKRYMGLSGMSAKTLAPQVVDPTPQIEIAIEAICIKLGVPKRIFIGSERGELASSQDKDSWEERLEGRRNMYLTPRVIAPFIDRLIDIGILPEVESYKISWPETDNRTREAKALYSSSVALALTQYITGGVDSIISPEDFLTLFMGMSQDEKDDLLENTLEYLNQESPIAKSEPEVPEPISNNELTEEQIEFLVSKNFDPELVNV